MEDIGDITLAEGAEGGDVEVVEETPSVDEPPVNLSGPAVFAEGSAEGIVGEQAAYAREAGLITGGSDGGENGQQATAKRGEAAITTATAMQLMPGTPAYKAAFDNELNLSSGGKTITIKQGDLHDYAKKQATKARRAGNLDDAIRWQLFADAIDPRNGPVSSRQVQDAAKKFKITDDELMDASTHTGLNAESTAATKSAEFDADRSEDREAIEELSSGDRVASLESLLGSYDSFSDQVDGASDTQGSKTASGSDVTLNQDFASVSVPGSIDPQTSEITPPGQDHGQVPSLLDRQFS